MPGKLTEKFAKVAAEFEDAMDEYALDYRTRSDEERRLTELPDSLAAPVRKVKEAAEAIVAAINADAEILDPDSLAERARVKGAVNEVKVTAQKMMRMGGGSVLWYEPTFATLYLAPLEVSSVLRENLFTQSPVIATSATLTVGKSFDAIAKSLGIATFSESEESSDDDSGGVDPTNVQMLDVGSPFDFANQGVLYLPRHLPEPGRDGPSKDALVELGELIEAAGGRTLALFSQRRG